MVICFTLHAPYFPEKQRVEGEDKEEGNSGW